MPAVRFCVAILLIAAGAAESRVVGIGSIIDILPRADLVVAGEVVAVDPGQTADSGSLQILPEEYLKGSAASGSLRIVYAGMRPALVTNVKGHRVMAFASKETNGDLRLIPMISSSEMFLDENLLLIDAPLSPPLVPKDDKDTPMQKVIKALATVHANSGSEFMGARLYLMPMAALGVEPETMRIVFRALIRSRANDGFVLGTSGLVALGGLEGLQQLDEALASGHAEIIPVAKHLNQSYKSTDPRGVAILARWLDPASPAELRAAAAGALARIHTADAIAALGPALQDPDFQIRWRAIGGCAMFANNVPLGGGGSPAAGPWPFLNEDTIRFSIFDEEETRKNEEHYLDFWRGWWRQNSAAVAKLAHAAQPI